MSGAHQVYLDSIPATIGVKNEQLKIKMILQLTLMLLVANLANTK